MERGPSLEEIQKATDYGSWFWFIFITVLFIIIWYGLLSVVNIVEVSRNWPKHRCSPSVMPFASLYGHNTSENFNYCVQKIFKNQMGESTAPYNTILGSMTVSMMEFLKNLNSLRIMMASLLGGITRVFQEFTDRFKTFMAQVKTSSLRVQMLMKRVFGTFYAAIYMGLSVIQTGQNFSQTFIFKFIDTFCFPPETLVKIKDRGTIPISSVVLGDTFETGDVVQSVYTFMANGQPMVRIGKTEVSTNHFIQYEGKWIEAKNHPEAVVVDDWNGGDTRPLICLDTSTHRIPIDTHIFSDWDETAESDISVMKLVDSRLNGSNPNCKPISSSSSSLKTYDWLYQPALDETIEVYMFDGSIKKIQDLCLGDKLSTGTVTGLGKRIVKQVCQLPSGVYVTPSQLLWKDNYWQRIGHIYPVVETEKTLYTIVIMTSAVLETTSGFLRDMIELYSSDTEDLTKQKLNPTITK
jgi:hypothetical protein